MLCKPPCLQEMVAKHGSFSAITAEAWAQFDALRERHREMLRSGEHYREVA